MSRSSDSHLNRPVIYYYNASSKLEIHHYRWCWVQLLDKPAVAPGTSDNTRTPVYGNDPDRDGDEAAYNVVVGCPWRFSVIPGSARIHLIKTGHIAGFRRHCWASQQWHPSLSALTLSQPTNLVPPHS
jgi:hypothetical protein